jgi:hypothetical protein
MFIRHRENSIVRSSEYVNPGWGKNGNSSISEGLNKQRRLFAGRAMAVNWADA